MKVFLVKMIAAAGLLCSASFTQAGLVLTSFVSTAQSTTTTFMTGWDFTVGSSDVTLKRLGYWDESGDGLNASHQVGLWALDGTLLSSAIVPAGTVAPLDGQWRMVDVTEVTLSAGITYRVGGEATGDEYSYGSSSQGPLDPAIASIQNLGMFVNDAGFSFPANGPSGVRLNANAFVALKAPAPGVLALMLSGLGGLAVAKKKGEM